MTTSWKADGLIQGRPGVAGSYKRSFLKQAICELRFPTLLELGEPRPPAALVSALRKEYPYIERVNEFAIEPGATAGTSTSHVFRSSKQTWVLSLRENALTLETTAYSGFENFKSRVVTAVNAALGVIDTDFFTRIGLRYINVLDVGKGDIEGWVNPALLDPKIGEFFKGISEYAGKIAVAADDGGCIFQHGVRLRSPKNAEEKATPEYTIDIDSYRSEIEASSVEIALDAMHTQVSAVFDWSISDQARNYLMERG